MIIDHCITVATSSRFHIGIMFSKTSNMFAIHVIFLVIINFLSYNRVECVSFFHFSLEPPPVKDIALMSRYVVHHSGIIKK